ncbi:sporulation protein [Streptomyces sp. NPDC048109]|uniref:sporulation protein n=1 Tax=Streptomyces sp. NPDC048109 TaxID=3155482 RepID=UPI00343F1FCC
MNRPNRPNGLNHFPHLSRSSHLNRRPNRRILLSAASGGALAAALPLHGRLPERPAGPSDRHRVRREEIAALHRAAAAVRHGDSRYGGGSAQAQAAGHLLDQWALPLFGRPLPPTREHELCAICAELARLAGWAALDTGRHAAARRHFDRALYWARAAEDPDAITYVLATMALHAALYSRPATALDMIQGALGPATHHASTRALAFTRLVEARAHARASDGRSAGIALASAERLLDAARPGGGPEWLDFLTHPRLAADAAEIHRDLGDSRACLAWHGQAEAMAPNAFTRSVGMRLAVVATAHLKAGDLEQSLAVGHRSVDILRQVDSRRARDYVLRLVHGLTPHRGLRAVDTFLSRVRHELNTPVA